MKLPYGCIEYDPEDVNRTEGPIEKATSGEVENFLKKMKNGKAPIPFGIISN